MAKGTASAAAMTVRSKACRARRITNRRGGPTAARATRTPNSERRGPAPAISRPFLDRDRRPAEDTGPFIGDRPYLCWIARLRLAQIALSARYLARWLGGEKACLLDSFRKAAARDPGLDCEAPPRADTRDPGLVVHPWDQR